MSASLGVFGSLLQRIESLGNRLPHPTMLFVYRLLVGANWHLVGRAF
jgi:p-aminobenzoyl-glutamate transporter AbgT